jgi:cytochrome c
MKKGILNCFKVAGILALMAGSLAFTGKREEAGTEKEVVFQAGNDPLKGKALMDKSDCNACHALDNQLVGPAYKEIAKKYSADKTALTILPEKIIKGGAGNWGQIPMSPHPQVSQADATDMVKYILSLAPASSAPAKAAPSTPAKAPSAPAKAPVKKG